MEKCIQNQLKGMKPFKRNNTMVNYDSPNGENLDDFMRLDASQL
jgi:hypothetical protein